MAGQAAHLGPVTMSGVKVLVRPLVLTHYLFLIWLANDLRFCCTARPIASKASRSARP